MSDDSDGHAEAGRWGTYAEAALHFKRSTRTIERWCDIGRLKRHPTAQPVMVWIPAGSPADAVSDMTDDTVRQMEAAEERALALLERMSDAVGQHTAPVLAQLNEALARVEMLARENGQKQERIEALERVVDVVRQMSDDERERADALAARLAETQATLDRERAAAAARPWWRKWW